MPLTAQQFGKAVQVQVIPPFGDGVLVNPELGPGAVQLRVAADVKKGIGAAATCTIDVWTLAEDSRDRAAGITRRIVDFSDEVGSIDGRLVFGDQFGDGQAEIISRSNGFGYVKLSAFYRGAGTTVALFEGTTQRVTPVGTRPTNITRIEATDGVVQDAAAVTDRQWRDPVSGPTVLEYVIREVMGTSLDGAEPGNFGAGLPIALANLQLPAGYDASNLFATDILGEFARVTDTEWWWDDGVIYWVERGKPLDREPLKLATEPDSGSFRILQLRPAEDNHLSVELLLLPELRPGWPVSILTGPRRGEYYCRAVEHRVDNRSRAVDKTFATLAARDVLPFA